MLLVHSPKTSHFADSQLKLLWLPVLQVVASATFVFADREGIFMWKLSMLQVIANIDCNP